MVGEAARLAILVAAAALASPAAAEPFDVRGACRDGEPQGIYELRETRGALRVLGAFSRGKRTGSFIYWTTAGDRIAHLPYDEGAISGTVALRYPGAAPGREPQQQLEAAYARGVPSGPKRSWHPDGSRRGDYAYERGGLFLLTMHPHIMGHRSRVAVLERLIVHMKQKGGVWFATHEDIAKHLKTMLSTATN